MILNIYVNCDYFLCIVLFFFLKLKKYYVYIIICVCFYYIIVFFSGCGLDFYGVGWFFNVLCYYFINGG